MRRVGFAFIAFLVLLITASAQTRPNFSGTWMMDPSRSESAHQAVPIGPVTLVIQQTAAEFDIETRRSEGDSSAVSTEALKFRLDGREATNAAHSEVPVKVKAHWRGSQLVAETVREVNGSTVTTLQAFQLGANGKELTVNKTLTIQHGYQGSGAERVTGSGKDIYIKAGAMEGSMKFWR